MKLSALLGPDLKAVLREDPEQVRELMTELHAEDVADIVVDLEPDLAAAFLAFLPAEEAAEIFERLEDHERESLVQIMPSDAVVNIASEMAADERADLFSALPDTVGKELLKQLERVDPGAAEEVREIEKWPETSAGHLMTTAYVHVLPSATVREAVAAVRAHAADHDEAVYNVYVHGPEERLLGIVSLSTLLLSGPDEPLSGMMRSNVISVPPDMDQEEVAKRMAKYDLNVMPVVDATGLILGVITIDDIVDVLTQEQTEDVQKLGAVEPLDVPYFQTPFLQFIKKRGVWLVVLFVGEFFTQTALRHYDGVFKAIEGASYYVPLLISAGGNSGSQSSTLVIRGMAVGEIRLRDFGRILLRELGMGFVLGLGLGTIGFLRVRMSGDTDAFALTVAATLIGIVMAGCTVGAILPMILKRIGLDPATSSTPFIASLVDVLGIVIFVYVAKFIMAGVIAQAGVHV